VTPRSALAFVKRHGIVLEGSRGPVPNLAEAIAGEPIKGSWWGHPKGTTIFNVTRVVRDSDDVLTCRLVKGKITFVHRRLWPVLVRLAKNFPGETLAAIRETHTASGAHATATVAFPEWVPADVRAAARELTESEARGALPSWK
jgi:hypothetical protein